MLHTVLLLCVTISFVFCDTPANCSYEDLRGKWFFHEGPRGNDKGLDCSAFSIDNVFEIQLEFPNLAIDQDGNLGFWTIIYNQGFEVVIHNRKYFAFSYYETNGTNTTSFCDATFNSWSHVTGVNPTDWSCYFASKQTGTRMPNKKWKPKISETAEKKAFFKTNEKFVAQINSKQNSWRAAHYDFLNELTIPDLIRMAGGKNSKIAGKPKPAPLTFDQELLVSTLPTSFDWRNISGQSFVSPVRNQQSCGSCYAFASMGMNEARLNIKTNNSQQIVFSPQDIVECSQYSQGCDGGFPYLISGKYAEDFGLVEESCNPYTGAGGNVCHTQKTCTRHYSTGYHYVGGFYGACNDAVMQAELVKNGPLVVSFEVYDDFFHYNGGVYHHTGLRDMQNFDDKFSPFELTNHAVLLVGYGTTPDGEDFWTVKNSWGTQWGESGFFRIKRGTDECAIESIAVGSDIIPKGQLPKEFQLI